ncbi:unnamed protein product, partial [Darwinula stevensoni]
MTSSRWKNDMGYGEEALRRRNRYRVVRKLRERSRSKVGSFDDALEEVGSYGRWQRLILWLIVFPACIPCGLHAFSQVFMSQIPPHRCRLSEQIENLINSSADLKLLLPLTQGGDVDRCREFDVTAETLLQALNGVAPLANETWTKTACRNGWAFNMSATPSSIVSQFELVCDKDYFPPLALALFNAGSFFGIALFGFISDWYGRRKAFFLCLLVEVVAGFGTGISPNFTAFCIARFMVGLTIPAIWQIPFIIGLEFVGAKNRGFVTVFTCFWFTLGLLMLGGMAFLSQDWKILSYVTAAPLIPFFLGYWFLPESPRWNLRQGNVDEAIETLRKIGEVNGKALTERVTSRLKVR